MNEQAGMFRAWIGGLRSGKYRQCFGRFQDGTGAVCALGVADVVTGEEAPLPPRLLKTVIGWNDNERLSFLEIADKLEADAVRTGIFDIPAALAYAEAQAKLDADLDAFAEAPAGRRCLECGHALPPDAITWPGNRQPRVVCPRCDAAFAEGELTAALDGLHAVGV